MNHGGFPHIIILQAGLSFASNSKKPWQASSGFAFRFVIYCMVSRSGYILTYVLRCVIAL